MKRVAFYLLSLAALVGTTGSSVQATVLDFNNLTSAGVNCIGGGASSCYGDNVNALSDTFGTYGQGNGFTPNVAVDYQNNFAGGTINPGLSIWAGSSSGTVVGLPSGISRGYLTFTADAGYNITLNSFEVGKFGGTQTTTFDIYNGGPTGTLLLSIPFSSSISQTLAVNLTAPELTISWVNWDTGLATINFDQVATTLETPIPAALPLFASGLGMMAFVTYRRKRKKA